MNAPSARSPYVPLLAAALCAGGLTQLILSASAGAVPATPLEPNKPVERELRPGEHCHVPARKAHRVLNPADAPARYLIVQAGAPYDYFPIDALRDAKA